jgi:hypothetical protein
MKIEKPWGKHVRTDFGRERAPLLLSKVFFFFFFFFFSSIYGTQLHCLIFNEAGELPGSNPGSAPSASSTYSTRLQAAWLLSKVQH